MLNNIPTEASWKGHQMLYPYESLALRPTRSSRSVLTYCPTEDTNLTPIKRELMKEGASGLNIPS